MNKYLFIIGIAVAIVCLALLAIYPRKTLSQGQKIEHFILTGAFLANQPSEEEISTFKGNFGKRPFFILTFIDWEDLVPESVIHDVVSQGCVPIITWEPWKAETEEPISYDDLLLGTYDEYIDRLAKQLGSIKKTVLLRFAHEMNGNWYPWSSAKIGAEKYKAVYRYVRDRFDALKISNVKWIFSINWENVPHDNDFTEDYPGDEYVDYFGFDGYNWGSTRPNGKWLSFHDLFMPLYKKVTSEYDKDILITEFSSTSRGGDKAKWMREALSDMKTMKRVKGFILFNVNKETDWGFPPESRSGQILKEELKDSTFIDTWHKDDRS